MEQTINERFVIFAGSKGGGSQRLAIPSSLQLERGQDVTVTIENHPFIYNVVKKEEFDNQDGTYNVGYLLKHTGE